jgi:D-alanyl-D-alanine carboxypeptidase/D-alanyl-D-alanine-endopeptidase (penicillin-binding protein 4)
MKRFLLGVALVTGSVACTATGAELPPPVASMLSYRNVPPETTSIHVRDLESGEVLVGWNASMPRNPGSTIKMLTTLAAIDILGPTYTWKTDIFALGPVVDGTLQGDLLLRGQGDPFLVTERVWQMLRQIRQAGIDTIDGDLLLDDSYFDVGKSDPGEFDRQPLRAYNVAPSALLMNYKVVRYWFAPAKEPGKVEIWTDPPLDNLEIDNRLRLTAGPCRGYQRGITVTTDEKVSRMTFSGAFPDGCERYAMDRATLSHRSFAYGLFKSMWREIGGAFEGGWDVAAAPQDLEPIVEFHSLPLADVITRVNKHSNNVMARQLLYTLSAEVLGPPGTEAGGREVIADWLRDRGLKFSELAFENGAGLSRDARITAADFAAMLAFAWRQPYMPEYVSSLSLAGLDGTLRYRMRDGPLEGSAHLKTGSLDHVAGIAGFLQARSGRRFSVVVLQNHTDIHRGYGAETQEALLRWLYEQ